MRASPFFLVLAPLLVALPFAAPAARAGDEEAPAVKRGFVDGAYVDDYFGISYRIAGLEKGFSFGEPDVLFAGMAPGDLEIEIRMRESPEPLDAAAWMEVLKKTLAQKSEEKPTDEESGQEPHPWLLFAQKSFAGFDRHHGYAVYPRGHQCFWVHAFVREKSETSGKAIKGALHALEVAPEEKGLLLAHLVARQTEKEPTDPLVLLQAGIVYVEKVDPPDYVLGLRALLAARAAAEEGTFDDEQRYQLGFATGLAQLALRELDEGIPTWEKTVELAKKSKAPEAAVPLSRYNLACGYAIAGRLDEAFATLQAAFEAWPAEDRGEILSHAKEDEDLANMRKDARWQGLFPKSEDGEDGGMK